MLPLGSERQDGQHAASLMVTTLRQEGDCAGAAKGLAVASGLLESHQKPAFASCMTLSVAASSRGWCQARMQGCIGHPRTYRGGK